MVGELAKVPSGIGGLDTITHGGLPGWTADAGVWCAGLRAQNAVTAIDDAASRPDARGRGAVHACGGVNRVET